MKDGIACEYGGFKVWSGDGIVRCEHGALRYNGLDHEDLCELEKVIIKHYTAMLNELNELGFKKVEQAKKTLE